MLQLRGRSQFIKLPNHPQFQRYRSTTILMQANGASAVQPSSSSSSKRGAARRGGAQQQQQLKLQVRGLPLTITLEQFEQACGEYVPCALFVL
jgi:hypothetical protein